MPVAPRQYAHHVRVSSVDEISYNIQSTGTSSNTSEAIQTIVTGRKCWKTIKGKGEVVWPPYLEAALVKGLEQYKPVDTRSARALGRFPMRNKFISDYIFETTGVRRTPKQVGSRLQQLRDTCEGKRILKLLSQRLDDASRTDKNEEDARLQSPPAPTQAPRDVVDLYVLPANAPWSSGAGPSSASSYTDRTPRPLRLINPLVTFRSAKPLNAYSVARVLRNGQETHVETTALQLAETTTSVSNHYGSEVGCTFFYSTSLVPGYWQQLCETVDIGSYSIVQDIVRSPSSPSASPIASSSALYTPDEILFSVVYRFVVGPPSMTMSPPQSPASSNGDGYSYSGESSPDDTADLDDLSMLHSFSEASLSSPPPPPPTHSPPHSRGASYHQYDNQQHRHQLQHPGHSHARDSMQRTTRRGGPSHSGFSPAPSLIRDGEDGYASIPNSPLDMAFPGVPSPLLAAAQGAGQSQLSQCTYTDAAYVAAQYDGGMPIGVGGGMGVSAYQEGLTAHSPFLGY